MRRLKRIDDFIRRFARKHLLLIFNILACIIKIYISYKFRKHINSDYSRYLSPWIEYIKAHGGFHALRDHFANYSQPYLLFLVIVSKLPFYTLYSIKALSIAFDFVLAFVVQKIVGEFSTNHKKTKIFRSIAFIATLLLPTVLLNSAYWAQCDVIYSTFALTALYFLIRKKHLLSFIAYGVAITIKLQAIFILPLFLIIYFKDKKISIAHFFIIPLTMIILSIPSLLVGMPFSRIFTVYVEQSSQYPQMTSSMINFWKYMPRDYEVFSPIAFSVVFVLFAIIAIFYLKYNIKLTKLRIIDLALTCVAICVYFLPSMHERYLFLGDVLSIAWAFAHFSKSNKHSLKALRYFLVPIGYELVSLFSYLAFLLRSQNEFNRICGCLIFTALVYYGIKSCLNTPIKQRKNKIALTKQS